MINHHSSIREYTKKTLSENITEIFSQVWWLVYLLSLSTESETDLCELEAIQAYRVSSRLSCGYTEKAYLKKKKKILKFSLQK